VSTPRERTGPDAGSRGRAGSEALGRDPGERQRSGHTEHDALARLGQRLPNPPKGEVWFGDDTAVVAPPGRPPGRGLASAGGPFVLLTTDTVVAGIDADLSLTSLADLGWKAMAVNLSDIAAMGGTPGHALVSVVGAGPDQLGSLYDGILEAAAVYGCPVVGGDLSAGQELVISIALTGWVDGPPVLRSGARPGDTIWVTRPLGGAAAGLRLLQEAGPPGPAGVHRWTEMDRQLVQAHARPRPALAEGTRAREAGATAMIDVSDGLVADISHIADLSGVGFELLDVPVAPGATLAEALGGGDDYVLAFTMPAAPERGASELMAPGVAGPEPAARELGARELGARELGALRAVGAGMAEVFADAGLPPPYLIGTCLPDPAQRSLVGGTLEVAGWDHSL
jgi:thiamine-monophosphate kinase